MDGIKSRKFWDKQAEDYARYDDSPGSYEARMMDMIHGAGMSFRDKTVLDIGCGTGMFTIRIARQARKVTALDISPRMLAVLEEDAAAAGVANITTVCEEWLDFEPVPCDVVFASMTPALETLEERIKFLEYPARIFVYIAYAGVHRSRITGPLYEKYGVVRKHADMAADMKNWLAGQGIAPRVLETSGVWGSFTPPEKMLEKCLEISGGEDRDYIRNWVGGFVEKGKCRELTDYKVNIFIWDKS